MGKKSEAPKPVVTHIKSHSNYTAATRARNKERKVIKHFKRGLKKQDRTQAKINATRRDSSVKKPLKMPSIDIQAARWIQKNAAGDIVGTATRHAASYRPRPPAPHPSTPRSDRPGTPEFEKKEQEKRAIIQAALGEAYDTAKSLGLVQ